MNVGRLFEPGNYQLGQIEAQLAALQGTGATIARADAPWEVSEPAPPVAGVHHYDWSSNDETATLPAAHSLRWLPVIDYTAPWAQSVPGQDHSPPGAGGDYVAYAAAFAARYGEHGTFWETHPSLAPEPVQVFEIWNEPDDSSFWRPTPDAARYAALYAAARAAITSVNPTARVIVGGLTHPARFLPEMLAARPDLRGHLDGVAIHPYAASPLAVLGRVRTARHALRSLGLGAVPLYVTEFGWTTDPPGAHNYLPAAQRPAYIASTISALGHVDCGVAVATLYTWITPGRDPHDGADWYGISPPDAGSSPDAAAFVAGLRNATAPGSRIGLCSGR